jgi:hypothetical protein
VPFYVYENREPLIKSIFQVLQPKGVWVFNITTTLGVITHNGKKYNQFSEIYFYHLDRYLKKKGYRAGIGKNNWEVQFISEEWETDKLHEGFSDIYSEVYPLPLLPSETFQFAIEDFYHYGLKVGFSETLMQINLDERIKIMLDVLNKSAEEMNLTGESPCIINIRAKSLSSE